MAFDIYDSVSSSPTNTFATLNVLDKGSEVALNNGNLHPTWSGSSGHSVRTTISFPKTSKWYLEVFSGDNCSMGLIDSSKPVVPSSGALWPGSTGFGVGGSYALAPDGRKVSNSVYSTFLGDFLVGSIIKILFDADSGILQFGIDSGSLTTAYTIDNSKIWLFSIGYWTSGGSNNVVNFGQDSSFAGNKTSGSANATDGNGVGDFYYDPPTVSGTKALALCTSNLPASSIDVASDDLPEDYFKCVDYVGAGASTKTINLGFNPDLLWFKQRTDANTPHRLHDSVRTYLGNGFDTSLESHNTTAKYDYDYFDLNTTTNVITLKANTGNAVNAASKNYIVWGWKAGGAPTADNTVAASTGNAMTANSVSLDGSLQSSYTPSGSPTIYPKRMSIGVKQGFSIIKYTATGSAGDTVPHGLGKIPEFIIVKQTNANGYQWMCYHVSLGATKGLKLQSTAAEFTSASLWNNTTPTSSVVTLGAHGGDTNNTDGTKIMYAFTSIPGYSLFSSYTGNGSADGPFIYTGFKPAWIMVKRIDSTGSWRIIDNVRNSYNGQFSTLIADDSVVEYTGSDDFGNTDILANGFKLRDDYSQVNATSGTYIFAAFSSMPQKYSVAR